MKKRKRTRPMRRVFSDASEAKSAAAFYDRTAIDGWRYEAVNGGRYSAVIIRDDAGKFIDFL